MPRPLIAALVLVLFIAGCLRVESVITDETEPLARRALTSIEGMEAYLEEATGQNAIGRDTLAPRPGIVGAVRSELIYFASDSECSVVSFASAEDARVRGEQFCQDVRRANGVSWSGPLLPNRVDQRKLLDDDDFAHLFGSYNFDRPRGFPDPDRSYVSGCYPAGTFAGVCWSDRQGAETFDSALRSLSDFGREED